MPHKLPKVEEVPVVTVKMLVFRDQVPLKWSEFCESPVKHTMSLAKCLQTCKIPECNCEAWHPERMQDGHTTEAVLDIWNRDFLTHGFKKTPAKEAQMFVFAARVQAEVFSKLTAFSGNEGLYIEPRSSDGRSHDTNFHTVWLPKANHTEAIAAKATSSKQTILVRVQNRYGLKVAMENASQIHEQFRSDTVFLGGQEKVVYTIGPMPWGASRSSLTALFKSWEWQAKPIQAISKSADNRGLVWTVQAMHPPASSVVTMEHGDVLIVRKDPEQEKKIMPPTIEASVRTKQSLQPVFAKDQPLKSDPWADSARRLPGNQMSSVASAQQVAQIEKQVEQRILEKIDKGDEPMSGTLEPRVHALENQIRQLQEAQSHQQKQTTQIAQQVSQVQGQVEQQTHKLQHHMDAKLAEQMTMIEALLNKRSRHEWKRGRGRHFACLWPKIAKQFPVLVVWLTIMFGQCRIGEAAHPGPSQTAQWNLGAVNPTGLSGKASILNSFDQGVYGVSESHLTAPGIARFRAELAQTGSKFKLSHGAPAPTKTASVLSTGGKHTGVGFLSSYPTRPIVVGWDKELWDTSRIHAAHFLVNQTWVTGGVAYGWAYQSESLQVKANTEALLQQLTAQVLIHPGPKFICGDFNQHPKALQETQIWENQGWVEIQDWAYRRHGIHPSNTCKGTSRKDFLYISPELQNCIEASFVHQETFADHAVLRASFQALSIPEVIHSWPKAKGIQLTDQQQQMLRRQNTEKFREATATKAYQAICGRYEQAVDGLFHKQNVRPLEKNQKGRGTILDRVPVSQELHPIKPSRHGEPTCGIVCPALRHKQWFTQLRRIVNLRRLLSHKLDRPSVVQHANALWRAILRAKGFQPNFRLWWTQRVSCSQVQNSLLPTQVPTYALISYVEAEFEKSFQAMENQHKKQCANEQFQKHKADANAVFRSVRDQGPEPVETLLQTVSTTVIEVVDAASVVVENSESIDSKLPILGGAGPLHVDMNEDNQIWFEEEHDLIEGQTITQQQPQGTYAQLFEAFSREWTARWDKHQSLPEGHWSVLVGFIQNAFSPDHMMQCTPITKKEWEAELQNKPKHAATGMDGVSVQDLRNMPENLVEDLLQLINHIESTGEWPEQLVHGAVHSLQKVPDACRVSQFRPITILPVVYRVWSSIRCKQLIRHLQQFAPPGIYGNVTGKSATSDRSGSVGGTTPHGGHSRHSEGL